MTITLPLSTTTIASLKSGQQVSITGTIYTMRDATLRQLLADIAAGNTPINLANAFIYHCGPTPPRQGQVIGACGPTTSMRFDTYLPALLQAGVRCFMGKGQRGAKANVLLKQAGAVYFATVGGAGAWLNGFVHSAKACAYQHLGPEAIFELQVKDFPAWVALDTHGNDVFVKPTINL